MSLYMTAKEYGMQERRVNDRKYLTFFSRVVDRVTGRLFGYLVDLSPSGALLVSDKPLKTDVVFQLTMDLPEGRFAKQRLDINARAVWSRPDDDPAFFKNGLRLVDMTDEDMLIIRGLLEDYGLSL